MTATPRAVIFDALGTLVSLRPPGPRLRAQLAGRGIFVSERAAAAAFAAEIDHYLAHHVEGSDRAGLERLRDDCARVLGRALAVDERRLPAVRQAMLDALEFEPYDDVAPALRGLRAAGLRLVVASNWDCSLPAVLAEARLRRLVDAIVTSAEVGAAKPRPDVIRAAVAAAGCEARDAVCVGDSLEHDVVAARAAGVRAVLLARGGTSAAPAGVAVVRSLEEVQSLVLPGR